MCRRAARHNFGDEQAERASARLRKVHGAQRNAQPGAFRLRLEKSLNRVAGNRQSERADNHCVDPDDAPTSVRERSTRIPGRKPHSGLHPTLRTQSPHGPHSVNHADGQRTHKTKGISYCDSDLSRPQLQGIPCRNRRQPACRDAQGSKIVATCAGIERPSQSSARTSGLRATCALVTMSPSLAQMTPEPQLRPPAWISTVERRNFSAISPIPTAGTLVPFPSALADGDR